jgi:lipid II isoglutaminyl synthase (glutamine-hydrolysing)
VFRTSLALIIGKLINLLSRTFKLGGGSAAPGLYALKIDPNLIKNLSSQIETNIIITGTNGKTTTARLLNHLLIKKSVRTLRNQTGSNLERGIASAFIQYSTIFGKLKNQEVGIWELDEAAFNQVAPKLNPKIIVFLNAFRDQLDRYGEVDTVVAKWNQTLEKLPPGVLIIANGDDTNTSQLSSSRHQILYYGIKGQKIVGENISSKSPRVDYSYFVQSLKLKGLSGSSFTFCFNGSEQKINYPLAGLYQVYNFIASFSVFHNLNLDTADVSSQLKDFTVPFGRSEVLQLKGKEIVIMLIKNPIGATNVFQTISSEFKPEDMLLIALNDNFADGKDVSWIWDAEFEELKTKNESLKVICSGLRANDLAVRLKYAGFKVEDIILEEELPKALNLALGQSRGRIFILPTYTLLLELQGLLTSLGAKKHYWAEMT